MSDSVDEFIVVVGNRAGPIEVTFDPLSSGYDTSVSETIDQYFGGVELLTETDDDLITEDGNDLRDETLNQLEREISSFIRSSGIIEAAIAEYDNSIFFGGINLTEENTGDILITESGDELCDETPGKLKVALDHYFYGGAMIATEPSGEPLLTESGDELVDEDVGEFRRAIDAYFASTLPE